MFQVCGDPNNDTCKEWMTAQSCDTGQVCENGNCVTDCTDECKQAGDRRCIPDPLKEGFEICGDYNQDDCLDWGQQTDCPAGQTCDTQTATCSDECQDDCAKEQRICEGNGYRVCGYYDADPCLDWSGITDCASFETCNEQTGRCEISCSDECPTEGDRRCSTDGYDTCGDFDSDPCLEWGGHVACETGFKCDGGECVEDCQDDCDENERVCTDNTHFKVCGNYDADPCREWSDIEECDVANGERCDNGVCTTEECQNECDESGVKECIGDLSGWHECGNYDADDCLEWSTVTDCGVGHICDPVTAECVISCSNECDTLEERECFENGWHECGQFDPDSCLEWSGVTPCGDGEACNEDTAQCEIVCDDDCTVVDSHQCSGDGYDICGDYDADPCLEWGGHVTCPAGTTCSIGECLVDCIDECTQAQVGLPICDDHDNGFRVCGEYDEDDCLDLSDITYCAYNEECQDGDCVVICTDECPGINEVECIMGENAWHKCGEFDGDPCLEWGTPTDCQAGTEMCYRGNCITTTPITVLINEILYDDEGIDGEREFIELYGPGGASLDNFSVEGVNGANGQIYMTIPLDGYTLPSNGHFVIATSIADAETAAQRDMTHGSGNLLQNDHDNVRVMYAGVIVIDALGYGDFSGGGTFVGEGQPAAAANYNTPPYDPPYTPCLSRWVWHNDTDDNSQDFWKRTICTPGWEGYGDVVWKSFVYGGSSTPAIDTSGNVYTVGDNGYLRKTNSAGARVYARFGLDLTTSIALSYDEQTLYVGSTSGLLALVASTGLAEAGWTVPAAGYEIHSSPAVGIDGTIYFGTRGDGFYAVNPDGSEKWNYPHGNAMDSSPALGDIGPAGEEYVVFGMESALGGFIVAIDVEDSDPPAWVVTTDAACNSSPAIGVDGTVYIGCDDGLLHGLDGKTGDPIADFPVSVAEGNNVTSTLVEGCSPTTVPEAGGGDIVYMTSHATGTSWVGNIYIYISKGGDLDNAWMAPETNSSITVGHDGSFLFHSGKYLYCYSLAGMMEWGIGVSVSSSGSIVSSPVIGPNGVVYLLETWGGSNGGYLWAIQGHAYLGDFSGSFPKFRGNKANQGQGY
jgi:outer membrane protein assembly factor BamB